MPYPNEHACRVRPPGDFEDGSFRRIQVGSGSNEHAAIIGRLKGKTGTTVQSLRYAKSDWSADKARASCERHGGTFEAARED